MKKIILMAEKISKRRDEQSYIFKDLSLELADGENIFITGKSGIGKSLFLKSLVQLTEVEGGRILYHGRPMNPKNTFAIRSEVQYFPQFLSLGEGTVEEFLKRILSFQVYHLKGQTYSESEEDIKEVLQLFSLSSSFLKKSNHQLSGGEAQMTHLLRMIVLRPQILLLDEPTSAMDQNTKLVAEKFILDYLEKTKGAAIWITHDRPQIQRLGKRVVAFEDLGERMG